MIPLIIPFARLGHQRGCFGGVLNCGRPHLPLQGWGRILLVPCSCSGMAALAHGRASSGREGEGPEPSAASKAGRGTHPTSGGELSAPVSEPGRFTPIHLWLAPEQPDRNIGASSGRSPERESSE